jgi:single-strand DNA-binding protein
MAILTGLFRLCRDIELRQLPDGTAVGNLALVYNYGPKPKNGGYRESQFVEASIWGKQAQTLAPYLLKGTRLDAVIDGVHVETFQKGDGSQGVKLVGRVNSVEFAGDSKAEGQPATQAQPTPQQRAAGQPNQPQAQPSADFNDDFPF